MVRFAHSRPDVQKTSYHSFASRDKICAFLPISCRREAAEWMIFMKRPLVSTLCLLLALLLFSGCSSDFVGKKMAELSLSAVKNGSFTAEQLRLSDYMDEAYTEPVLELIRAAAGKLEYEVGDSVAQKGAEGTEHHVAVTVRAVDCRTLLLDPDIYRAAVKTALAKGSFSDLPAMKERAVREALRLLRERVEEAAPSISSNVTLVFAKKSGEWTVTNIPELIPAFTGIDPATLEKDILSTAAAALADGAKELLGW